MTCKEWEDNILLYLYGELEDEVCRAFEAHRAECAQCQASLADTRRLHEVLSEHPVGEPSPALVLQCRLKLDEALDQEQLSWRGLLRSWILAPRTFPAARAATLVALLAFGFGLGWSLRPFAARPSPEPAVHNAAALIGGDLDNLRISGVSPLGADPATGDVRVRLDGERQVTLEGSLDDPRIQQVLVDAVKSYDNPGIRRDTLDALRARSEKPPVRAAMVYAMRHDPNAGVRLAAMEAVQAAAWDAEVRQVFLEALERDSNPGVRVAAIDALSRHADKEVLPVLERLAADDPNAYVRIKCAGAIRRLVEDDAAQ
jgi:hypothetical protein